MEFDAEVGRLAKDYPFLAAGHARRLFRLYGTQARQLLGEAGSLDELLSRRRKTRFFLAHPRAIAAFGRECNRRGIYPEPTCLEGQTVHAWRGLPLLPCNKIPISEGGTRTRSYDEILQALFPLAAKT